MYIYTCIDLCKVYAHKMFEQEIPKRERSEASVVKEMSEEVLLTHLKLIDQCTHSARAMYNIKAAETQ